MRAISARAPPPSSLPTLTAVGPTKGHMDAPPHEGPRTGSPRVNY